LEALETELKNELAQINATIETLKAKDEELDKKIADLKTYVDTELGNTTDWVNATFATLEQYNALVVEIATIKEQIKAINQSITDLETKLTTKINEDIANAVSTLNADIQQKVSEITSAYTVAISIAKSDITTAYTAAIAIAISNLETSLKSWVGEQLSNYYTIAEVEAKITALQTAINNSDTALQEELESLKLQLETTATEITAAYKKAIEEAINMHNGVINTKIANEIASVNQRITNEVTSINAKIAEIESRLDNIEAKLEDLLARIQSVSYIPTYDDGRATIKYTEEISRITLDFEVSPKHAYVTVKLNCDFVKYKITNNKLILEASPSTDIYDRYGFIRIRNASDPFAVVYKRIVQKGESPK
jgi:chromosome segregation ATPase